MAETLRIEELRRRVRMDPASIAFAALAEEYRRAGRLDEAIDTCASGLKRHPSYVSARVTLGRALFDAGRYDEARSEFEAVLRTAPENLAAVRGLADTHAHVERPKQAAAPPPGAPDPEVQALEGFLDAIHAARRPSDTDPATE